MAPPHGNHNSGRRPGYRHHERTREKIQVTQIVNRLHKLVMGEAEMAPHAVTAALGLLKKVMPDMSAVEHTGEVAERYVIAAPQPVKDIQSWLTEYGDAEKPPIQ